MTSGSQIARSYITPDSNDVIALYLSPSDEYIAIGTENNQLAVHRVQGERIGEQLGAWEANLSLKAMWADSGRSLAFVDTNGDVRVVHLPSGRSSTVPGPADAVAIYPDESRLAIVHASQLMVYEFNSQAYAQAVDLLPREREYKVATGNRLLLAVSPDARWLACNTQAGMIRILDSVRAHEFRAHQGEITDMEWISPSLLVTSSADETIRIWDIDLGRELRVLEVGEPLIGVAYAPHWRCVVGWTRNTYLFWSIDTGQIKWQGTLAVAAKHSHRTISASRNRALVAILSGPAVADIVFSGGWDDSLGTQPGTVSTYTNAKVLLLGDSGVGKSGLALVLAGEKFRPTESTHARRIWRMPAAELNDDEQTQREILIWTLPVSLDTGSYTNCI
jgi:WD40 repeat protein